ncbi:MAG: hypothetical protein KGI60_04465 [Patescibacteria group bacterium]|nr:hypothetical protein [Patescibacteria group bacterium]
MTLTLSFLKTRTQAEQQDREESRKSKRWSRIWNVIPRPRGRIIRKP